MLPESNESPKVPKAANSESNEGRYYRNSTELLKKLFRFPFYIQLWLSKEAYLTRFAAMLQNLLLVLVARFTLAFSLQWRRFLRAREFFHPRESAMLKLLSPNPPLS